MPASSGSGGDQEKAGFKQRHWSLNNHSRCFRQVVALLCAWAKSWLWGVLEGRTAFQHKYSTYCLPVAVLRAGFISIKRNSGNPRCAERKQGPDPKLRQRESLASSSSCVQGSAPTVMGRNLNVILHLWAEIRIDGKSVGSTLFWGESFLLAAQDLKNKWTLHRLNAHVTTKLQIKNHNQLSPWPSRNSCNAVLAQGEEQTLNTAMTSLEAEILASRL